MILFPFIFMHLAGTFVQSDSQKRNIFSCDSFLNGKVQERQKISSCSINFCSDNKKLLQMKPKVNDSFIKKYSLVPEVISVVFLKESF